MARKAGSKAAPKVKKTTKKAAGKKIKKAVKESALVQAQEQPIAIATPATEVEGEISAVVQEPESIVSQPQEESLSIQPVPVVDGKEDLKNEEHAIQETKQEKQEIKTEVNAMADGKGVGKDYNPSDFSQKPAESGEDSSKVYMYVGLSVVLLAVVIGGIFFFSGFGKSSGIDLTGSTVVAFCSDTDGGYNRFTKGVASGTYYLDYHSGEFMDACEANDENKLTEYYCKNDLVVYATEPCPEGLTCTNGICE